MSPRPKRRRTIKIPTAVTGFVPESGDFDPNEKVVEYRVGPRHGELVSQTVAGFVDEVTVVAPEPESEP